MADNKKKVGSADRARVAGKEPYEVARVATKTSATPAKVREAVERVGPMRAKVEKALTRGKR